MPVLGRRIGEVRRATASSPSTGDGDEPLLRYYDHVFPVRPGTEDLPMAELLDRQFYRLAHWRVGDEELNYRRFFDIDTLAGVRVEDEQVFDETHARAARAGRRGPRRRPPHRPPGRPGRPARLPAAAVRRDRRRWVVVEKILEGDEELPADWPCAGTTGYDALLRVGGAASSTRRRSRR